MSRLPFPSADEGRELHRRLLAQDSTAPLEVCTRYAEPLLEFLLSLDRHADEQACNSAVGDALMNYVQRPETFDPAIRDLSAFLRMAAKRDLSNLARAERRHHRKREADFRVEDANVCGNHFEDDPAASMERREEREAARVPLEAVRAECDEEERLVLDLMIEGERSTERFAAVLGEGHTSEEDQRRAVKRVKDRIKKRIERKGGSYGEPFGRDGRAEPA